MVRRLVVLLVLMTAGMTAYAGEKEIDIASIDKNLRHEIYTKAPALSVIEKYAYYEIRGNDEKELRRQMGQNGTRWNDGKTYDALTSWTWDWDYGYERTAQGCSVDSFKTTVNVTFRYPKWARTDEAPQTLTQKWDGYMKNLIVHESGHSDMAVKAAEEFSRTVAEMPPAASCGELDRKVKELSSELMAKLNANSREYDDVTVHGTTQGAVFP